MKSQSGITLLEALIAIAILAIVLALGVPSFRSLIESNQVRATTNSLSSAFQLARSEAIKTRSIVSVCVKAANQNNCENNPNQADWNNGWLVVRNNNVLRTWDEAPGDVNIVNDDNILIFQFRSNGTGSNNSTFTINAGNTNRTLQLSRAGRVSIL